MNYYPFHLGDYAAHTSHLEPMEDIAYRRMLDLYYRTEKQLPLSVEEIARLIRMKDYAASIRDVLNEFFERTDEGWKHARCDEEIARMQDKQAKAKASAQASVNARRTNAQRTLNERSTKVELPTPTPTPNTSVAKATGAEAPDSADTIFSLGVALLTASAVSERNARAMLGRFRKDHGDEAVIAALQQCADAKPLQPVAWLQSVLKVASNGPIRAQAAISEPEWRRVARERNEAFLGPASASAAARRRAESETVEIVNVHTLKLG